MMPPKRTMLYEKIKTDDFVLGFISNVLYDMDHPWKAYEGKEKPNSPAIRLEFTVEGYKYPHKTPWMAFNLGEKANLYKKYVSSLVMDAKPNMEFDLDLLKNMKVKMLWKDNGDFQHIETIRPTEGKISFGSAPLPNEKLNLADAEEVAQDDDSVPF